MNLVGTRQHHVKRPKCPRIGRSACSLFFFFSPVGQPSCEKVAICCCAFFRAIPKKNCQFRQTLGRPVARVRMVRHHHHSSDHLCGEQQRDQQPCRPTEASRAHCVRSRTPTLPHPHRRCATRLDADSFHRIAVPLPPPSLLHPAAAAAAPPMLRHQHHPRATSTIPLPTSTFLDWRAPNPNCTPLYDHHPSRHSLR